MKSFFEERNLLVLIDRLARQYNKTPYEVASGMTLFEFDFNVAVMLVADIEAQKEAERLREDREAQKTGVSPKGGWGTFGIHREVVKET